jgi:Protein of unknown function (DUF5674)
MMALMIQTNDVAVADLRRMANPYGGELVKAVVDIRAGRLVVDMEYHVDGEQYLLSHGSHQEDLWGINLHPDQFGAEGFVEFDSIINLRPRQNRSRGVDDPALRQAILDLVALSVHE